MNYFDRLPLELFHQIIFSVEKIYYYYSLNVLNHFWNQIITSTISKDQILRKYSTLDNNLYYFRFLLNSHYLEKHLNTIDLYLIDLFIKERNDFNFFPVPIKSSKKDQLYIKMLFMIKHHYKNELEELGQSEKNILFEGIIFTCVAAIYDKEILIYLHENGCPWNDRCCENASMYENLECLKYLHENGCPWNEYCCVNASQIGNLEVLKYLHENGCPWDEKCCEKASQIGNLEVLKYLHENGCDWSEDSCRVASEFGHIEVLKYLYENGCPCGEYSCRGASEFGQMDVLKYLYEKGCPGSENYIWDINRYCL